MTSKLVILLLAIGLCVCEETCPEPEVIAPCKCVIDMFPSGRLLPEIQCVGRQVKDLRSLSTVFLGPTNGPNREFSALYINDTDITEVPPGTFGDAVFHSMFFGNNLRLANISHNAFRKADANHLFAQSADFYNNPLLGATPASNAEFFKLLNVLQVQRVIDITMNGIYEIPDHAFEMNPHLMNIYILLNPGLRRVGSYAFSFLPNLLNLIMYSNHNLTVIDAHAFELSTLHDDMELDLSWNHLTEKSFSNLTFGTQGRAPAEVNLFNNYLTSVPAPVFRSHLGTPTGIQKLILHGNPIRCDCHVKWIRDDDLTRNIPMVNCADFNNRNLYALDVHELPTISC